MFNKERLKNEQERAANDYDFAMEVSPPSEPLTPKMQIIHFIWGFFLVAIIRVVVLITGRHPRGNYETFIKKQIARCFDLEENTTSIVNESIDFFVQEYYEANPNEKEDMAELIDYANKDISRTRRREELAYLLNFLRSIPYNHESMTAAQADEIMRILSKELQTLWIGRHLPHNKWFELHQHGEDVPCNEFCHIRNRVENVSRRQ